MAERSAVDQEYITAQKEPIYKWCCKKFAEGKDKVKLMECKEAFMTIPLAILEIVFAEFVDENKVQVDLTSRRVITYIINEPPQIAVNETIDKTEVSIKLHAKRVAPTETADCDSPTKKPRATIQHSHQRVVLATTIKAQSDNDTNISEETGRGKHSVVPQRIPPPAAAAAAAAVVHTIIDIVTGSASPRPVAKTSSIAVSSGLRDLVVSVLSKSFQRSGGDSLTLEELKVLLKDTTTTGSSSATALLLDAEDNSAVDEALMQLEADNKIMYSEGTIYQV